MRVKVSMSVCKPNKQPWSTPSWSTSSCRNPAWVVCAKSTSRTSTLLLLQQQLEGSDVDTAESSPSSLPDIFERPSSSEHLRRVVPLTRLDYFRPAFRNNRFERPIRPAVPSERLDGLCRIFGKNSLERIRHLVLQRSFGDGLGQAFGTARSEGRLRSQHLVVRFYSPEPREQLRQWCQSGVPGFALKVGLRGSSDLEQVHGRWWHPTASRWGQPWAISCGDHLCDETHFGLASSFLGLNSTALLLRLRQFAWDWAHLGQHQTCGSRSKVKPCSRVHGRHALDRSAVFLRLYGPKSRDHSDSSAPLRRTLWAKNWNKICRSAAEKPLLSGSAVAAKGKESSLVGRHVRWTGTGTSPHGSHLRACADPRPCRAARTLPFRTGTPVVKRRNMDLLLRWHYFGRQRNTTRTQLNLSRET